MNDKTVDRGGEGRGEGRARRGEARGDGAILGSHIVSLCLCVFCFVIGVYSLRLDPLPPGPSIP